MIASWAINIYQPVTVPGSAVPVITGYIYNHIVLEVISQHLVGNQSYNMLYPLVN